MIITISRQFGAGGSEIARRVAGALGWRVVDNELIGRVAKGAGLPPEEVAQREERAPSFIERLARLCQFHLFEAIRYKDGHLLPIEFSCHNSPFPLMFPLSGREH